MLDLLGFNRKLFKELSPPQTVVGGLKKEIAEEIGYSSTVVLPATHDTASAVEGIPMTENSPYISSGTWSLLGIKLPQAITDENSRIANYSNEGGFGYFRYQKNIMGMWVVNRLRDELCPEKPFPEIVKEAEESIYPYQDEVDVIINSSLNYEIGVLKIYAEPLLFAIREDSDYYKEAYSLINLLRNFLPISSELVPKDSVLREFIGTDN